MTDATMRAWRSLARGREGLAFETVPVPRPGPGEVLVRVEAAALNFSDVLMAEDRYQVRPERPFTMGQEVAGTIVAVGEGTPAVPGNRVAAMVRTGGFAEYALVPVADLLPVPAGLTAGEAAALPVVYMTAALALTESTRVEPGETVLVLAAAGGVGLAAVEIAAALGATVVAAAGGAGKGRVALERGAAHAVDYDEAGWPEAVKAATGGRGIDVVVDNVGGERTGAALRLLAPGGRLLVVGFASGSIPDIPANRLLLKGLSAIGVYLGGDRGSPRVQRTAERLTGLVESGRVRPQVGATFALGDLPDAMAALAGRRTTGKVVLLPDPSPAGETP